MRVLTTALLMLILLIGCENPMDKNPVATLYKGRVVQNERAPFLVNQNSLAKISDGILVIDPAVSAGTVYGLEADTSVYAATGGEALPEDTWVDNLSADPIQADIIGDLIITFDALTTVTLIDADGVTYWNSNGAEVLFSGTGIITATKIITDKHGSATLISTTKFAIGGDGGENS